MAFHLRLPRLLEPGEMCITHRDEVAALLLPGGANASAAGTPHPPATVFRRPLSLPPLSGTGIFAIYRVRRRRRS